jgi:hypothetical protein
MLTVACLLLAGFASVAAVAVPAGTVATSAAVRARPALKVTVDWPKVPISMKRVTVHVRRPGAGPTTTRLERQFGSRWVTVVNKKVKARSFVFRTSFESGRVRLRVVLPHVTSRIYTAPMQAPLVRRVDYADGPVQTRGRSDRVIALLFRGRRGQLVDLATVRARHTDDCAADRLRGPSGKVIAAARPGMWRLPRTATYRVEAVPCWAGWVSSADLTLVRLVPLDLNAAPVRLHAGNGVTDAGVVTVPETGRVMVRGWDGTDPTSRTWRSVTYPTGLRQSGPTALEAGKRFTDGYHYGVITPGRYLFYPGTDNLKASASSPLTTSITPEGPAVTLGDDGVPGREREFTFTGTAGTLIYPGTAPSESVHLSRGWLYGPDGYSLRGWHYGEGWLLHQDGQYTLRVVPSNADTEAGTPVTVRLRQAVTLPPMQYGAPTRFALDGSDRWMVTTIGVPHPPYTHHLSASDSTMSGPWEAIAGSSVTYRCGGPGREGPNGCGDNYFTTVNQDTPTAPHQRWGSNPALVVLRPGAGLTGSVDLTFGP